MKEYLTKLYKFRWELGGLRAEKNRNVAWDVLVSQEFQKFITQKDVVLDLGCGQGQFINRVNARKKIAVDLDPMSVNFLDSNVYFFERSSSALSGILDGEVDIVFTSNLFEHLADVKDLLSTLSEIHRVLSINQDSRLIVMMPNIDKVGSKFYDFLDHRLPLNPKSLHEALRLSGFEIEKSIAGFFPYSAVGAKVPISHFIVKCYLLIPARFRPFAGQMLIVATKKSN
jgi:SAM-dependent methyltransferase